MKKQDMQLEIDRLNKLIDLIAKDNEAQRLEIERLHSDSNTVSVEDYNAILSQLNNVKQQLLLYRHLYEQTKIKKRNERGAGCKPSVDPETTIYIKKLRGEGLSFSKIAKRLDDEGIPAPKGETWAKSTVFRLVKS